MKRTGASSEGQPEAWDEQRLEELDRVVKAGNREAWMTPWGARRRKQAELGERAGSGGRRAASERGKSRAVAILLALLLGGVGVHRFYLGNIAWGFSYLIFSWTGIPALIAFAEAITFLVTSDEEWAWEHGGPVHATSPLTLGCLWVVLLLPVLAVMAGILLIGCIVWWL